jgi:hypothetical protein
MEVSADYVGLVRVLLRTRYMVDASGQVLLTDEEAAQIRQLGFPTVGAGWWSVPAVPPELVRDNPLLEHLALHWPTYLQWEWDTGRTSGHVANTRLQTSSLKSTPIQTRFPLDQWLAQYGRPEHPRILQSLWRRRVTGVRKRVLQQVMHRIPACRFNNAIAELLEAGFLRRIGTRLTLSPSARAAIETHVNQVLAKRAQTAADEAARRSRARDARLERRMASGRPSGTRARPQRNTSAWGRWMFAKRGGYAMQRKCRILGINPTEKATRVRMMKQALSKRARLTNTPPRSAQATRTTDAPFELTEAEHQLQREADDAWVDGLVQWSARPRFR